MSAETPVERRLREMAERRRKVAVGRVEASWLIEYARLTASLEVAHDAIALLRRIDANEDASDVIAWDHDRRALLARCEGRP